MKQCKLCGAIEIHTKAEDKILEAYQLSQLTEDELVDSIDEHQHDIKALRAEISRRKRYDN